MVNGAWKMLCNKGCGWNESHTTKYHDEHQRSAATFKVPPHHPYWLLLGKSYAAATVAAGVLSPSVAGATQVPTSSSVLASLTSVVDRHMTNVESAEMSSFLGELRNVLGNQRGIDYWIGVSMPLFSCFQSFGVSYLEVGLSLSLEVLCLV